MIYFCYLLPIYDFYNNIINIINRIMMFGYDLFDFCWLPSIYDFTQK